MPQVPLKQLVEFERFSDLAPGKTAQKTFSLDPYTSLSLTASNGSKVVYPVSHGWSAAVNAQQPHYFHVYALDRVQWQLLSHFEHASNSDVFYRSR